jgi:hypothetical protein
MAWWLSCCAAGVAVSSGTKSAWPLMTAVVINCSTSWMLSMLLLLLLLA